MRAFLLLLILGLPVAAAAQNVSGVQPANGASITTNRPTITAWFDQNIESAQIWIDGREFTGAAQVNQTSVSVTPGYNLDFGTHTARVVGRGFFGEKAVAEWSFTIVNPAPQPQPAGGNYGTWRSTSGNTFVISGSGNQISITLYSPDGKQYPGGGTWIVPGQSFRYTIPALNNTYSEAAFDARDRNILHVRDAQGGMFTWNRVR